MAPNKALKSLTSFAGTAFRRPFSLIVSQSLSACLVFNRVHQQYRSTALGFTQFQFLCLLNHRRHHRGTYKLRFASNIETLDLSRFARHFA
jgi:hypothetical protein